VKSATLRQAPVAAHSKEHAMKSRTLLSLIAITVFTTLTVSGSLVTQDNAASAQAKKAEHHLY
jgi:hypothetical protein